jgi:hypothetical protein
MPALEIEESLLSSSDSEIAGKEEWFRPDRLVRPAREEIRKSRRNRRASTATSQKDFATNNCKPDLPDATYARSQWQ